MRRIDLRHKKDDFLDEMSDFIRAANKDEVIIFLFEIGDFSNVEKAVQMALESECELINSLKFNQTDWTIVVKGK